MPLFRRSAKEWWLAQVVPLLTHCFRFRKQNIESTVVTRMCLWERFLSHRNRRSRSMTFAIALADCEIVGGEYIPAALAALVNFVLRAKETWENQPLNVVVTNRCRSQVLDPRDSTGDTLSVAVVDDSGRSHLCNIHLEHAQSLTCQGRHDYIAQLLAANTPLAGSPVSVIFNSTPTHPEKVNASFADFPGAWLRVAPDSATGGLVASADHVVLDGAMFQELLLDLAQASSTSVSSQSGESSSPEQADEPVVRLRIDGFSSLTEVLKHTIDTLQDFGIELLNGRDTAILVTIPQGGPDVNQELHKQRRRILPVIMDLDNAHSADEIRRRIQDLCVNGWCSLGAQVWNRLYCGNVSSWLVYYMERIAPAIPFQRVSRYLSGAALISCLPPIKTDAWPASRVTHLSCRTMSPPSGGPTITIMQVCGESVESQPTAFITIGGTGSWGRISRLKKFRDSLAQRIHASQFSQQHELKSVVAARSTG